MESSRSHRDLVSVAPLRLNVCLQVCLTRTTTTPPRAGLLSPI